MTAPPGSIILGAMTTAQNMLMFSVFTLAGIGLCVRKHWAWGIVCFVIALASIFFML